MDNITERVGDNMHKGTAGELLFAFEAYRRGLYPCVPSMGDPPCFDMVVINRISGRPVVVQVKTAVQKSNSRKYQAKALCQNDSIHLNKTNVQYLCVYTPGPNVWYMVPVGRIRATSITVFPLNKNSRGQYERFKENWKAFGFSSDDPVLLS